MKAQIGIVGCGFVGGAIRASYYESKVYDPAKDFSEAFLTDLLPCDAIFICVPTPVGWLGQCDTYHVEHTLSALYENSYSGLVIIKSTVTPDVLNTYGRLLKIAFIPEFLRANSANADYLQTEFMIVGTNDKSLHNQVENIINSSILNVQIFQHITLTEASLVKYFENNFLAVKVSLMNEFKLLTEKMGSNWNRVINALTLDERIGTDHTQVPGPDGKHGFGGHCLPKDVSALLRLADFNKIQMHTIEGALKTNEQVREE